MRELLRVLDIRLQPALSEVSNFRQYSEDDAGKRTR